MILIILFIFFNPKKWTTPLKAPFPQNDKNKTHQPVISNDKSTRPFQMVTLPRRMTKIRLTALSFQMTNSPDHFKWSPRPAERYKKTHRPVISNDKPTLPFQMVTSSRRTIKNDSPLRHFKWQTHPTISNGHLVPQNDKNKTCRLVFLNDDPPDHFKWSPCHAEWQK